MSSCPLLSYAFVEKNTFSKVVVQEMFFFRNYRINKKSEVFFNKKNSKFLIFKNESGTLSYWDFADKTLFEYNKVINLKFYRLFFSIDKNNHKISKSIFSTNLDKYNNAATIHQQQSFNCSDQVKFLANKIVDNGLIDQLEKKHFYNLLDKKTCSNISSEVLDQFSESLKKVFTLNQNNLISCLNDPEKFNIIAKSSWLMKISSNSIATLMQFFDSKEDNYNAHRNIKISCETNESRLQATYELNGDEHDINVNVARLSEGGNRIISQITSAVSHELMHIGTYLPKSEKNCVDENYIQIMTEICNVKTSSVEIPNLAQIYSKCEINSEFRTNIAVPTIVGEGSGKELVAILNELHAEDSRSLVALQNTPPISANSFVLPGANQLDELSNVKLPDLNGNNIQPGENRAVVLNTDQNTKLQDLGNRLNSIASTMGNTLASVVVPSANASGTQANQAAALAQGKINLANAFAATGFISEKTASEMKSMALGQGGLASSSSESSGSLNTAALQAQDSSANGLKVTASNQKSAVASGDTGLAAARAKKIATTGARVSTEGNKEILSASSGDAGQMVAQNQLGLNNIKAVAKSTDTVGQPSAVNKRGVASIDSSGNQARVASTEITSRVSGGLAKNDNRVLQTLSAYKRLSGSQYKAIQELYDKQDFDKLLKSRRISIQVKQNAKNEIVIGAQSKAILSFVDDGKSLTRVDGSNAKVDGK